MVVEAVHVLTGQQRSTSINDVARELGLDQSGASRMVTRAQRRGFVTRHTPGRIGATSTIVNTAAGEELLRQAHAWQDDVLRTLTADCALCYPPASGSCPPLVAASARAATSAVVAGGSGGSP